MNLQDREVELNFREVTCKRSVQGPNFSRGIQDYDFSVSGKNAFIPSLSYFVIDVTLTSRVTDGRRFVNGVKNPAVVNRGELYRRPYYADGIALADHFGSTLYNNAFFRAGNSDVSLITQYIPQAGVLKSRLDKSGAWSKNIGRIVMHDDADFDRRRKYVSQDGKFHDDGLINLEYTKATLYSGTGAIASSEDATLAWTAATGLSGWVCTTGATDVNMAVSGLEVGDIIEARTGGAGGVLYKLLVTEILSAVLGIANGTAVVFYSTPIGSGAAANLGATAARDVILWKAKDSACGFNQTQIMFQPPLGIFSEANPISGGDFKISLNPSPSYKRNGIQTLTPLTPPEDGSDATLLTANYNLVINDVKFYVCTIKSDVSPSGVIPLSLIEMAVINKTMNQGGGSQNLDFTVPPSTLALTVFLQMGNASSNTYIPATKFYTGINDEVPAIPDTDPLTGEPSELYNNFANRIQGLQVTYGSVTKTQTLYPSALDTKTGVNKNIQRFLQSIQYSGKITSEGGSENHPQYLERGNYWHFDFSKDKNDTSSYVNVQIDFGTLSVPPSTQLFLVAHYSRQAEIMYENGFITQVVSVNR